ncbi:MAG: M20/M25/M40 family metallo-hydrolase [Verrucomicrobiales bacterium]|nr:M20/M25/M40 family metallo-hydrolase [Verrucomicrobiales bacterium]MBP9223736.1 M20/M25/M40 family metallo-hydrolase [Verrucomicrobiales bacterium]
MGTKSVSSEARLSATALRERLGNLREILFANIVMAAEIPAPTGQEQRIAQFLRDRFTESGLESISRDHVGNVACVLPGRSGERNLLVAAHLDKIWSESDDHTVSVGVGVMKGRGIADNSVGVAVLATLPLILEELGIELESNLILLGATRSFGRGDLRGIRFFLENSGREIHSAVCLEGIDLGRLTYTCLGMARGEIRAEVTASGEVEELTGASGVVGTLSHIVGEIQKVNDREMPESSISIGSLESGTSHGVPPLSGILRFEIRSSSAERVSRIEEELQEIVAQASRLEGIELHVEMIARRRPGTLGEEHPLVKEAGRILRELGREPHVEPSVSELSALLDRRIPSLTLGLTRGDHRHSENEVVQLEPVFDGLAQLIAMLQFMDCSEFSQ